jgi:8-oxo-dGTP pyrophosphatase MutT (NUDIX family)
MNHPLVQNDTATPFREKVRRGTPRPDATSVVAVVVTYHDCYLLLQRSASVGSDPGLWHCISGYLDPDRSPRQQACIEITEEIGLVIREDELAPGPRLDLFGDDGRSWCVYTFAAVVQTPVVKLDWEHQDYRWVSPGSVPSGQQVPWCRTVLQAFSLGPSRMTA